MILSKLITSVLHFCRTCNAYCHTYTHCSVWMLVTQVFYGTEVGVCVDLVRRLQTEFVCRLWYPAVRHTLSEATNMCFVLKLTFWNLDLYQQGPHLRTAPQFRTSVKQRVNCFCTRKTLHSNFTGRIAIKKSQITAEKCNLNVHNEIENSRARNRQNCHCTASSNTASLHTQIPIGNVVRNWGLVLLTRDLISVKKGH